ncbi:pilus assembly protein TadG-related protein [Phreatobacter sp.]|uniref:pilus assembly protein TadG-related protein n=1 Tax=Phreatobacter sp. TaxID=1966341 RepID=UPI003F714440
MFHLFSHRMHRDAGRHLSRLVRDRSGNVAVVFAIAALPLLAAVGAGVDYSRSSGLQARMQASLDASLLAGLRVKGQETATARQTFSANFSTPGEAAPTATYNLNGNTLNGTAEVMHENVFGGVLHARTTLIRVQGSAIRTASSETAAAGPCLYVLDPKASQSLLVNSGAKLNAPDCEVHVHSKQNPAAIFNAGTTLNVRRFCIAGTNIIKNTSASLPIELGCAAQPDPFAGKLPTPTAGNCSNTKQVYDPPQSGTHVMAAGSTWCSVIFNGSPKIVFQPGLHIIKGSMIINSGSTVTAEGVTFFFVDTGAGIQFNGGITAVMTAPTSGTHANILMFEPSGGTNRSSFVFNSSVSETISGLIDLPNRNVTYNATSNIVGSKVTMVFNTLILNQLDWKLAPGTSPLGTGAGTPTQVRLTQ